eukprot:TRINITY_DN47867_c0_g1_i1.p2 TRINITY_DN47867_c0_g1~~TRINITY_DN47867_c0_g1_i1.p2  ORF type:complete len:246 (+),score=93.37 TRINITY_DN47867_c0_g1_i1:105-842(+)
MGDWRTGQMTASLRRGEKRRAQETGGPGAPQKRPRQDDAPMSFMFNKFDFSADETARAALKACRGPSKQSMLAKLTKVQEKIRSLSGTREGVQLAQNTQWQNAMDRAAGIKVKDDPTKLKKALKKKRKSKEKSWKLWQQREEDVKKAKTDGGTVRSTLRKKTEAEKKKEKKAQQKAARQASKEEEKGSKRGGEDDEGKRGKSRDWGDGEKPKKAANPRVAKLDRQIETIRNQMKKGRKKKGGKKK